MVGGSPSRCKAEASSESLCECVIFRYRKRWTSVGIAFGVCYYMLLQDSMYWISLWPYLSVLDPNVTENFFGFVIMGFNLASAVSSPIFGYWMNRIRKSKWPIVTGILLEIIGNAMLALAGSLPQDARKWGVLISRLVSGFGMGSYSALASYIAMATTLKERNFAVSTRFVATSAAALSGPAIMLALYSLGYPGGSLSIFQFNMYTAPAYINLAIGALELAVVLLFFHDYWITTVSNDEKTNDLSGLDWRSVAASCYMRFMMLFCFTFDVTVGSPLTMVMFNWSKQTVVLYNGFIQLADGLISIVGNILIGNVVMRYVRERTLMMFGAVAMLLYFVLTFSYPGQPVLSDGALILANSSNGSLTNCDYAWCSYTSRVNIVQYLVGYACMSLAFLTGYVPNATLFSKVLGPVRQGTLQGIFAGAGQIAMTISPIVCGNLFHNFGPRVTWAVGGATAATGIVVIALNFRHLLPYREPSYKEVALTDIVEGVTILG